MRLYPEFRQDLVIREHKVDGKAVYWVKDPVANTFFRFIVFQYYVATLLDGTTSLEEIGSTNGTYVDGAEVGASVTLQSGSLIKIGATIIKFEYLPFPSDK